MYTYTKINSMVNKTIWRGRKEGNYPTLLKATLISTGPAIFTFISVDILCTQNYIMQWGRKWACFGGNEPYEVSSAFIKHASFSCENNSTSPPTLLFLQSPASNLTRFTFLTHTWHLNGPIAVGLSCFVYTLVVLSMTPLWFPKFTPFSRWSTLLLEH